LACLDTFAVNLHAEHLKVLIYQVYGMLFSALADHIEAHKVG